MPGLGDLVTNFTSNTAGFDRGVKSTKSGIKSFESTVKTSMAAVKVAFIGATAGIAAVAGAVYGLSGRISKLAGVADEAVKTGLSGAFLQRLGYAADQSGVDVGTLTAGIKKLTVAIGKGDEKPFAALGLSLKDLKDMSPEDQFSAVAGAIGKLPTAADRAAAAVKIFGKSGIEMTGLFAGGLNEVNKLMADAKALGIGVSDEDLAKAAAADDAIQRMSASFGALADKAAVTFAPMIESIADGITGWLTPLNQFADKFNAMAEDQKWTWLGDTLVAAFDVAIENIGVKFDAMLKGVASKMSILSDDNFLAQMMDSKQAGENIAFALGMSDERQDVTGGGGNGLASAQQRLAAQMAKLNNGGDEAYLQKLQNMPDPVAGPAMQFKKKGGTGDFAKLGSSIAERFGPIVQGIQVAAMDKIDGLKRNASFFGEVGKRMFTGDAAEKPKQFAPQFAGAMTKGSAGAYSTIIQAITQRQNPQVKATEKSTKDIVKAITAKPPAIFNVVAGFFP